MRYTPALLIAAAVIAVPQLASAQAFNVWLNARRDSVVRARIEARDGANEVAPVSASSSNSSLVDRAGMPDVAGISINLPGQPHSGTGELPIPTSLSATPFMFLALLKQMSPLDPKFFMGSALARRIGFNATFDTDSAGHTTTALQFKVLVLDRGNPFGNPVQAKRLSEALGSATDAFIRMRTAVIDILYAIGKSGNQEKEAFINSLANATTLDEMLKLAGKKGMGAIDRAIEDALEPFVVLKDSIAAVMQDSRRRPELSLGGTYKKGGDDPDRFRGLLIFDWAPRKAFDITFNAGMERLGKTATTTGSTRAEIAGQVLFKLSRDNPLSGKNPLSLTLATAGSFGKESNGGKIIKVQAKLLLPVAEGVNVPLSATWANRKELIEEARVNGQVGFTFDISRIFAALQPR